MYKTSPQITRQRVFCEVLILRSHAADTIRGASRFPRLKFEPRAESKVGQAGYLPRGREV